MKKLNKLFLGLASAAAVATPIATVVSCGSSSKGSDVMLITDSGSIDDKSFNQQGADALKAIKGVSSLSAKDYIKPANHDAGTLASAYESAASQGAKMVLAPGFYHSAAITNFNAAHKDALKFILVDGEVKAANVASIQFDTKQPAFLAGYWAAESIKNETAPVIGMWGGGNFSGVTDYMAGFVAGVQAWAKANSNAHEIKFVQVGDKTAFTNSGFDAGQAKAIADKVAAKAQIILPVAGGQTADAISAIQNAHSNAKIVGVDTDQSKLYNGNFLTSITKNVSQAFQAVYSKVHGGTVDDSIKGFNETTVGTLTNHLVGIVGNNAVLTDAVKAEAASSETEKFTWDAAYAYMDKHWAA